MVEILAAAREENRQESRPGDIGKVLPWSPVEGNEDERGKEIEFPANSYAALGGTWQELTADQLEPYLRQENRSAESLIAATELTGDVSFLREAAERFPDDARVLLPLAVLGTEREERMRAAEAFRRLEPQNSLADYLLADELFLAGERQKGRDTFLAAGKKPEFRDYAGDFAGAREGALLMSGFSPLQARAIGFYGMGPNGLGRTFGLGKQVIYAQQEFHEKGETETVEAVAWAAMSLHAKLQTRPSKSLKDEAWLIVVEKLCLQHLPLETLAHDQRTVAEHLSEAEKSEDAIRELAAYSPIWPDKLKEEEAVAHFERVKSFGELKALRMLMGGENAGRGE